MFHKPLILMLVFISLMLLSFAQLLAQEDEGVITILSNNLGEVIDQEERNKYWLFPGTKGFQSAVLIKLSNGNYVFKITCLDQKTGEKRFIRIAKTESEINRIKAYIDNFNEKQREKYQEDKEIITGYDSTRKVLTTPPLNGIRITGELLVGGAGSFALGLLSFGLAVSVYGGEEIEGGSSNKVASWLSVGTALGSSFGVFIIGNIGDETGSYIATLSGSILGALAGFILREPTEDASLFFFPPIVATIGFNITRKYKSPNTSGTAVINFRDGNVSSTVPLFYVRLSPSDRRTLMPYVNLISIRF